MARHMFPPVPPAARATADPTIGDNSLDGTGRHMCQANVSPSEAKAPRSAPYVRPMTEAQWMTRVLDTAAWHGWRCYHPFDSRRSTPGWPDLTMVRRGRLVIAELKTASGRVTPAQREWLADLSACPGVETYLWRPEDWPTVKKTLASNERTPA